jgi:membrane protease YdiL (CAAX protease family)
MDKAMREAYERLFLPRSLGHGIALFVFVAVVGPFAEELLFRGALYTGLRPNQTPAAAGWTTAVLFTLSHFEPRFWPSILLLAVLMATLRAVSGSLWPSVFLHAAFNATALSKPLMPFLKNPSLSIVLGCIPISLAIVGAIVWIGRSSASADRARRVDLEPDPGVGETDP